MNLEVQGTIYKVGKVEQVTETFSKRVVVINTGGEYAQFFPVEFHNDKTSLLDSYKENDEVKINANFRGRSWLKEDKEFFFLSLQGWRISKVESELDTLAPDPAAEGMKEIPQEDDLPF